MKRRCDLYVQFWGYDTATIWADDDVIDKLKALPGLKVGFHSGYGGPDWFFRIDPRYDRDEVRRAIMTSVPEGRGIYSINRREHRLEDEAGWDLGDQERE